MVDRTGSGSRRTEGSRARAGACRKIGASALVGAGRAVVQRFGAGVQTRLRAAIDGGGGVLCASF